MADFPSLESVIIEANLPTATEEMQADGIIYLLSDKKRSQ